MKNNYWIEGNTLVVQIYYKGDMLEAYFDVEDFDKVDMVNGTWAAYVPKQSVNDHRKYITYQGKEFPKRIYAHQYIKPSPEGMIIDHKNWNGLDNRKNNLEHVTTQRNLQNRRVYNSTSGVRNVRWDKTRNKWKAEVWVDDKNIYIGRFEQIEEAEQAVIVFKQERGIYIPNGGVLQNDKEAETQKL